MCRRNRVLYLEIARHRPCARCGLCQSGTNSDRRHPWWILALCTRSCGRGPLAKRYLRQRPRKSRSLARNKDQGRMGCEFDPTYRHRLFVALRSTHVDRSRYIRRRRLLPWFSMPDSGNFCLRLNALPSSRLTKLWPQNHKVAWHCPG